MTRSQHAPIRGVLGSFLTVAAVTLATASHADPAVPFSGVFIEGGVGYSRNDAKASDTSNIVMRDEQNNNMLSFTTYNSADGKKQSESMGRLSLGYGYMLPYDINLAIVGGYSTSQKITSKILLRNIFDVRFQPGYYIAPARTLIYASLGYARAKLSDSLGRADMSHSLNARGNHDNNANVMPIFYPNSQEEHERTSLNGLVLGGGLKFSPAGKFYVGLDYSYIKYKKKTYDGSGRTTSLVFVPFNTTWTQTVEPRSNNLLLTLGYYFF